MLMIDCPGKQTTVRNSVLQNGVILAAIFPAAALRGGRASEARGHRLLLRLWKSFFAAQAVS